MRALLYLLFFLGFLPIGRMWSQVTSTVSSIDFGVVERGSNRVVDVTFTNADAKSSMVLTTKAPQMCDVRWSNRAVEAGGSVVLRVKLNPRQEGRVNEVIEVFFANMNTSIQIKITADVRFVDAADNTPCPDFSQLAANTSAQNTFTVEVVDAVTQIPIKQARVRVFEQGRLQRDVRTDRFGIYAEAIPIGYYYVLAESDGYLSADTSGYINRRNNAIRLELMPLAPQAFADDLTPPVEADEPIQIITGGIPDDVPVVELRELPQMQAEPQTPTPRVQFKPNTIVFLVDVSQSMYYKSRLELLKASMLGMIKVLRDVDQVALVSYAQTTEEVIGLTSASEGQAFEQAVTGLMAAGQTAGAKGFRKGYALLSQEAHASANNQLIVVTDGAFRTADAQTIVALAEEYTKQGIVTTLVGVRSSESGKLKLQEIAVACGGSVLFIDDIDEGAEVLLREITQRSQITN
jgi:Ca-activated chloride channel family protein